MGYGITIRVQGEFALFTRPEMKVERVSYEVMTPSAARGIIEAIYWKPAIRWIIDEIHVLKKIEFTNIRRNEVENKTSTDEAKRRMKGATAPFFLDASASRQQRASMVLRDVDYLIKAHFDLVPERAGEEDTVEKHYNIALRRLRKGQHYHAPCLGTREFGAEVTLIEADTLPQSVLSGEYKLGWMLYDMDFTDPTDIQARFFEAKLQDGVLDLKHVELKG